jgi:hypothetical protein
MDLKTFFTNKEQEKEFRAFQKLKTSEEKKRFFAELDEKFDKMTEEEKAAYREGTLSNTAAIREKMEALTQEIREIKMKTKLGEVPEMVSLNYVAKRYFNKSRSWLHQRLNGYNVNGKPAAFTSDEQEILVRALQDMAEKIQKVSLSL